MNDANGNDKINSKLDAINVSGVEEEPLWVATREIAAVGVYGTKGSLLVLVSGKELVAKGTHPNEIISLMIDASVAAEVPWQIGPGRVISVEGPGQ